jgi:hypothetical protein
MMTKTIIHTNTVYAKDKSPELADYTPEGFRDSDFIPAIKTMVLREDFKECTVEWTNQSIEITKEEIKTPDKAFNPLIFNGMIDQVVFQAKPGQEVALMLNVADWFRINSGYVLKDLNFQDLANAPNPCIQIIVKLSKKE